MKTISLESQEQLDDLKKAKGHSVIFKHNTSCPISKNTRSRFENDLGLLPEDTTVYFLDLQSYRDISDSIAEKFNVEHESPQMLVIKDGECPFHQSLYDISADDAAEAIRSN